jgi:hypothetical protein
MKKIFLSLFILLHALKIHAQIEWIDLYPVDSITDVQPMTGIVFWHNSSNTDSDVLSLEYSYMLYNDVVKDSGKYNWDAVEQKLNAISNRKHQAIFRFRYVYPGYETSVPDYISNRSDYHETVGLSEGKVTHFPDWTNPELKRFTLEFYSKFAERYDNDPRLAFLQVGFGLWAEYHIYSGPFILGVTFPDKAFQEAFFCHLDSTFKQIPWSISIDAADSTYSPFKAKPELKNIRFGLFDDSFMHKDHSGYNTSCWNFFGRERYKTSPAGGEFSYYTDYDQQHVLDLPGGPYGQPYEKFARDFHITYIIGNDQPEYQTMERIKQASMASGYRFKIVSLKTAPDTSVFEILNYGVAPIYYNAYIAVDGIRSPASLKLLAPGDTKTFGVSAGAMNAAITIECDRLVEGQKIQFYGTQELPVKTIDTPENSGSILLYPNPVRKGEPVFISGNRNSEKIRYVLYNGQGKPELIGCSSDETIAIETGNLFRGIYFLRVEYNSGIGSNRFLIL